MGKVRLGLEGRQQGHVKAFEGKKVKQSLCREFAWTYDE
jgi:hypothetical protein